MAETNLSQQEQDEALLQKLGYKQELRRTLGFLSNFAVAFSYISVSTGTFSLFALGIVAGGPAFFWTWPIVAIGQFIVALNFAELASHFPIAGSIYQWSKRLSGHSLGWFTGWFYFFAGVLTITGVAFTIPIPLQAIFNVPSNATVIGLPYPVFVALLSIVIGTIIKDRSNALMRTSPDRPRSHVIGCFSELLVVQSGEDFLIQPVPQICDLPVPDRIHGCFPMLTFGRIASKEWSRVDPPELHQPGQHLQ